MAAREETPLMQRLRAVRQANDLTLEQAGRACGIAASTLSKIENGLMSPTYDVLQKLAIGLSLDVSELFTPAREPMGAGRCVVDRAGQGKVHKTRYYEHLLLCSQLSHKRILPFLTRITARDLTAFSDWNRHEGEEFVYVISGQIQLHTEFYSEATLGPGDSFYIDSRMGHRCISVSQEDAQVLWMATQRPEAESGEVNE
ncbi:XRE family transcriptional regulator [Advenella incenata]|jgi:transcriptional regulator with XRE-family HTH domain|uniref:XRE family transcriptional regulator n=1 Tax=Advenella incenata TaxID=267800 RepID=A0A4Q7VF63_9BURK|nr:XRE family transcriptional regulator [Advenella incenata]RZT94032.1 XRE family transcriptional regulator [Advenella incenata]